MDSFVYTAYDLSGAEKKGLKRGTSEQEIYAWLHRHSLIPVEVKPAGSVIQLRSHSISKTFKRPKSADMAAFCWQLATMIEGGVLITEAIETVAEDIENHSFRHTLIEVCEQIKRGESFSSSISQYPKVFDRLFCSMILAGETSGSLPTILDRLGNYFDARDKFKRKLKNALLYPVFVLIFVFVVLTVMMTLIIPRFRTIFAQIGGDLPAFTKGFIKVYDILMLNGLYLGVLCVFLAALFIGFCRTQTGHMKLSNFTLKTPLFGRLILQAFISTFCKTVATLMSAGVSIIESFDIASEMTNNDVIRDAVIHSKDRIIEGSSISLGMAASGVFPNMVSKMVDVGEKSGSLPKVLDKASSYYENKMDSTITTLLGLLGPTVIVFVGGIVLIVVVALYLPIFSMSNMTT